MIARTTYVGIAAAAFLLMAAKPLLTQTDKKPIWAKQAMALDLRCSLHPRSIPSPNRQSSLGILCHKRKNNDPTFSLQVKASNDHLYEVPLDEGAHELLWAPDSSAFFVDGSTSAYAGFFIAVYQITSDGSPRKQIITNAAQRDMVASFPPCKASNRDEAACARITKHPEYNMSGLAWANDSSSIDVFAEVPCSSSYGGIMCQVLGYELSVPDGRIVKRLNASQVSQRWRDSIAWNMHIPDAPTYGPSLRTP